MIIICDDDSEDIKNLIQALESNNHYKTIIFHNCHDLVKAIDHTSTVFPDLIFIDFMLMNGPTGLECLEYMRKNCPKIPVIMMVGAEDSAVATKAYRSCANAIMLKPFNQNGWDALAKFALYGWLDVKAKWAIRDKSKIISDRFKERRKSSGALNSEY